MRTRAPRGLVLAALLIPFLLLPNFTFLVALSSTQLSIGSGQSSGAAAPGSVTSTSYAPIPLDCPHSTAASQPLLASTGAWNLNLSIPYSTFNGVANNASYTERFTVFQNGTFLAADDKGNKFETGAPTSGMVGSTETSLKSNTTTAVQTTILSLNSRTIANITLTFSVYRKACQPAGVRVVASGGASWGTTGTGAVSLPFKTKPTSVSRLTAWFGHAARALLVITCNTSYWGCCSDPCPDFRFDSIWFGHGDGRCGDIHLECR